MKAKLKNFGSDTLKSCNIGWSVNGVVQTSPATWNGALPNSAESGSINIGSFNFLTGSTVIKIWTKNPNGGADSNKMNDTMTKTIVACNTLSGTYIIDKSGGGNYLSINDALASLMYCGVSGPVRYIIKAGNYYERVAMGTIPGISAVNTVTFEGVSRDSVSVIWNATSSAANAVFVFNGTKYVTLKNLTIDNNNATYAACIQLANAADYNTIENCILKVNTTVTTSSVNPIVASSGESASSTAANAANYCMFKNNLVIGGYYSIKMYGASSAAPCTGNQFIGNTFREFYYYGTYLYYQRNMLVQSNSIIAPRYSYAYSMYIYYCYNSKINANLLNPGSYGMYVYYNQNVSPDSTLITNNMITNFMNGTYQIGIYNYYSNRIYELNNSIWIDGTYTTTTSYGCIYNYYTVGNVIKNNILKSTGNLYCFLSYPTSQATQAVSYNNYIAGINANVAYVNSSATYKTLALWKAAASDQNLGSMELEPGWVSKTDLHLTATSPTMFGANLGVLYDYDGDSRCDLATTMGCDEYPYTPLAPHAGFVTNDTACINSPVFCRNIASVNDIKFHSWVKNGVTVTNSLNYLYSPVSVGIDTVRLITRNCFGKDTFTKRIVIRNPVKGPSVDFIANKNKAIIGETVYFSDLSTDCPAGWEWNVSPDSIFDLITGRKEVSHVFVNGTTKFSQNPQMQFRYSDTFDICLKSRNILDSMTVCKPNYIYTLASYNICYGDNQTEEPEGYLYDNGGISYNYTSNKFCNFYIHPCAANLSVSFSRLDIKQGDYLRVYDGHDKTGIPLWNYGHSTKGIGDNDSLYYPALFTKINCTSGEIYVEFESDASLEGRGFEMYWTSVPGTFNPPIASFDVADSVCNGSKVYFENKSTGFNNKYYWDFDGNNSNDVLFVTNPGWVYKNDGIYYARLLVVNCGGIDTFRKAIVVYTSPSKPKVSLVASNNRPAVSTETVNVTADVYRDCADTFSWKISPSTYTMINGNLHNGFFDIRVNDTVCYDFTLISGYKGKYDTVIYPCFIRGIDYCIPDFSYFTKDVGISRVSFAGIDQVSTSGTKPYEDFTNVKTVTLEQEVKYPFIISRPTNNNYIQRKIWIDYNVDGDFGESNELIAWDTLSNSLNWTGTIQVPITVAAGKTRLRVGVAAIGQNFDPCSILNNGEYEDYSVYISPVITRPVITLNYQPLIHINQCGIYSDSGAVAFDILGNNLTSNIVVTGSVNPLVPTTYRIRYNVTDKFGNTAIEVVRTVIVDADNVKPDISIIGKAIDTIVVKNSFIDPGFNSGDNCSGMDTVEVISALDTAKLGTYQIEYKAFDVNGNFASAFRQVVVIDNIPPVITVFDPDTILLDVNTALNPRVLKITDNYYTEFTIVTTGSFYANFNTGLAIAIGKYSVIYEVYDGSGNKAVKTFWIKVVDKTKPDIILNGSRIISLCRFQTIAEPGWVATDDLDPNPKVVKSGSYYSNYLVLFTTGWFEMKYTVTDYSGNSNSIYRLVIVTDSGTCASSIPESKLTEVKVYPNPTSGITNLVMKNVQGRVDISLIDVLGHNIQQQSISDVNGELLREIDMTSLPTGTYYLRIINNDKVSVHKLIRN